MWKLAIEFTNRCNLACIWCGSRSGLNEDLSLEDAKHAILKFHPREVCITGGEPLLRGEELLELLAFCKARGIRTELFTNALLLQKYAQELEADRILVSVDGIDKVNDQIRGKGVFKKIETGLHALENAHKLNRVMLVTAIGKLNQDQPEKILAHFFPKIRKYMFGRVIPVGRARPEHCISLNEALKIWVRLQRWRIIGAQLIFSVQFWQLPGPAFLGPVLRTDGKFGYCCVRYNEIIGDLNSKKMHNTCCLFCTGCSHHNRP